MKRNKNITGCIAVILAACMWGCIGIFTRRLTEYGLSPIQLVFIRSVFTSLILFIYILIKDKSLLRFKLRDIWMFLGTGLFSFCFFNVCYMLSMKANSLSVACVLMYTSLIWVSLISAVIFKEKLTFKKILSMILCLGGCVLICLCASVKITGFGLAIGLLTGFGYALYSIFGKIAAKKYSSLTITFYTFLIATAAFLPVNNPKKIALLLTDYNTAVFLLGITVLCTILPYLFYTYGLSAIDAGKASVLSIIEPAVATLVGAIVFAEKIYLLSIIGMVIIVIGIGLQSNNNSKSEVENSKSEVENTIDKSGKQL